MCSGNYANNIMQRNSEFFLYHTGKALQWEVKINYL